MSPVPPAELVDYVRWCGARRVPAYGDPDDLVSMRSAAARWRAWCDERQAWAAANGHLDEDGEEDLEMVGATPWDPDWT